MPYYSEEIIESVREANNIVEVVGQYVKLQKRGSNYFGLCPFHNEKTASFSVSEPKQIYYCFGCGTGGNVISFLQRYENLTFPESIGILAERAGITLPDHEMTGEERARKDKRTLLLEINKEAAKYYYHLLRSEHGRDALEYFRQRKLSDSTMQRFGLGYSDKYSNDLYRYLKKKGYQDEALRDSGLVYINERRGGRDKFFNRAMFPIMDQNSKVIAFGGRVMGEGEPKYLNSPESDIFNKSRTLYGLNAAKHTHEDYFILCEGYMDVIALHQAGFDSAIASLGTAFTEGHAAAIRRYGKDAYLSYDSDNAGQKAALRAIPILREAGISCRVINMSPYKDPDEFIKGEGADEYRLRIENAENAFMFTIRMLQKDYDLSDPGGRSGFARACAARILEFREQIERDNYIEAVAGKYNMRTESLRALVAKEAALGIEKRKPVKSSYDRRSGKDIRGGGAEARSQRLILRWLCEYPDIYGEVSEYIGVDDFKEGIMRMVARAEFDALDSGGRIDPSGIIGNLASEDEMKEASRIFFEDDGGMDAVSYDEMKKALREVILVIRRGRIERLKADVEGQDAKAAQNLVEEMRALQEMEKEWQTRRQ